MSADALKTLTELDWGTGFDEGNDDRSGILVLTLEDQSSMLWAVLTAYTFSPSGCVRRMQWASPVMMNPLSHSLVTDIRFTATSGQNSASLILCGKFDHSHHMWEV